MKGNLKYYLLKLRNLFNPSYRDYLDIQFNRSYDKYAESTTSEIEVKRKNALMAKLESVVELNKLQHALVMGCRNSAELDMLEAKGVKHVQGIDLYSFDPRVQVMDMHNMEFGDNMFDLIYASHVLEHAMDADKVFSEMKRVSVPRAVWVMEVPINFKTGGADRIDYQGFEQMLARIQGLGVECEHLLGQNLALGEADNHCGTAIARLIVRLK